MLKDEDIEVIKQEYEKKNVILSQFGEWVSGVDLYEDMFGRVHIFAK